MALDDKVSALIGDIYEGATDPAAWDRAVTTLIDLTAARFVLVAVVGARRQELNSTRFIGPRSARFLDVIDDYNASQFRYDPVVHYAARHPCARIYDSKLIMASSVFDEDPYLRWVSDAFGSRRSMTAYSALEDGLTFGVALHPADAHGPLGERESRLFRSVFDHMERAVRLSARPPDFDHPDEARLLIDSRGVICKISEGARKLLAVFDGLSIQNGRLHALRAQDSIRIDALVVSALRALSDGGSGGMCMARRPSGRRSWLVKIAPMSRSHGPFACFGPAAEIRIIDPDAHVLSGGGAIWREMFGLTLTETRLAEALMETGDNLHCIADRMGMCHSTARVHLRHIFDKTEARGQAALVRLLQQIEG